MIAWTKAGLNDINRTASWIYYEQHLAAARECRQTWLRTFPAPKEEDLQIGIVVWSHGYPMVIHRDIPGATPLCDFMRMDAELQFCKEQYEAAGH